MDFTVRSAPSTRQFVPRKIVFVTCCCVIKEAVSGEHWDAHQQPRKCFLVADAQGMCCPPGAQGTGQNLIRGPLSPSLGNASPAPIGAKFLPGQGLCLQTSSGQEGEQGDDCTPRWGTSLRDDLSNVSRWLKLSPLSECCRWPSDPLEHGRLRPSPPGAFLWLPGGSFK